MALKGKLAAEDKVQAVQDLIQGKGTVADLRKSKARNFFNREGREGAQRGREWQKGVQIKRVSNAFRW